MRDLNDVYICCMCSMCMVLGHWQVCVLYMVCMVHVLFVCSVGYRHVCVEHNWCVWFMYYMCTVCVVSEAGVRGTHIWCVRCMRCCICSPESRKEKERISPVAWRRMGVVTVRGRYDFR